MKAVKFLFIFSFALFQNIVFSGIETVLVDEEIIENVIISVMDLLEKPNPHGALNIFYLYLCKCPPSSVKTKINFPVEASGHEFHQTTLLTYILKLICFQDSKMYDIAYVGALINMVEILIEKLGADPYFSIPITKTKKLNAFEIAAMIQISEARKKVFKILNQTLKCQKARQSHAVIWFYQPTACLIFSY